MGADLRDLVVWIDGEGEGYPCKADPSMRWNGWLAAPWFDRATVQRVVDDLVASMTDSTFEWRGDKADVLVELVDGEVWDSWAPNGDGLYCLGANAWCWTEKAARLDLTETDLRVLRLAMGNLVEANPDDGEVILLDVRIAEALESLGVKL